MNPAENASYAALADEYYDPVAHPTCHNLNRLSRVFIGRHLPEPWNGQDTLEVGAGDSCVAAILYSRGYGLDGLHITDASERMLQHSQHWARYGATLMTCDATSVDRRFSCVSLLIASLGDPYNTDPFWAAAYRAVTAGGKVLFTTPSFEWSARFRGAGGPDSRVAEFVLKNGQRLYVPSYVMPLHEQVELIEAAGFMVTAFESLGADDLHPNELRSPKINVFGEDLSSLVWGFEVVRLKSPLRAVQRTLNLPGGTRFDTAT